MTSPDTPPLTVRPARPAELERLLPVCVEAFADEAVSAWVEPDPARRRRHTHAHLAATLPGAADAGGLLVAYDADGTAVAASLWAGPERARVRAPEQTQEQAPEQPRSPRVAAVLAATAAHRPAVPHVHLAAMAALPHRRGTGAGTAMLRHGLSRAHAAGLPVYLEASTPRSRALYARHGFRDLGAAIPLPDGGPVLQPMWHP